MSKNPWMIPASCALLAACGGGGGIGASLTSPTNPPSGTNASPGGYFTGSLSNPSAGSTDSVLGLITENGDGVLIDSTHPAIYRLSSLNTNGNALTATYRGYAIGGQQFADGSTVDTGTVTGTVQERVSITGTYTGPSNSSGTFNLNYQGAQYAVSTPLATLVGTYQFTASTTSGTDTVTFTINTSSQVIGSDTLGCTINGTLSIPNPAYNAQQFRFGTTCSGTTRNYTGVSTYTPASSNSPAYLTLEYDDATSVAVAVSATKQ